MTYKEYKERALLVIEDYYKDKKAKRTQVPYINHIYEGLNVLNNINADIISQIVYILHPIFQTESKEEVFRILVNNFWGMEKLDDEEFSEIIKYGFLYKKYANSYLSKDHKILSKLDYDPNMPKYIKEALIADKVQNYKDFLIYHKGTHPNSDLLDDYFKTWLICLGISQQDFDRLKLQCRKRKIVFFTGSGISAESGIKTFRDEDGTWEEYKISEVATLTGWRNNKAKVLDFYNSRIKQLDLVHPNLAHLRIKDYEKRFDVTVITQNVDDLHERAGSNAILHLHGELRKKTSSKRVGRHTTKIPPGEIIKLGDVCPDGSQWRPFVVWFGELVPGIDIAKEIINDADVIVVIGTSLQVYPAATLIDINENKEIYQIDPNLDSAVKGTNFIQDTAIKGMEILSKELIV